MFEYSFGKHAYAVVRIQSLPGARYTISPAGRAKILPVGAGSQNVETCDRTLCRVMVFGGWDVSDFAEQTPVFVPVNALHRRNSQVVILRERPLLRTSSALWRDFDRLGHRVVVGVVSGPDRGERAGVGEALRWRIVRCCTPRWLRDPQPGSVWLLRSRVRPDHPAGRSRRLGEWWVATCPQQPRNRSPAWTARPCTETLPHRGGSARPWCSWPRSRQGAQPQT